MERKSGRFHMQTSENVALMANTLCPVVPKAVRSKIQSMRVSKEE